MLHVHVYAAYYQAKIEVPRACLKMKVLKILQFRKTGLEN